MATLSWQPTQSLWEPFQQPVQSTSSTVSIVFLIFSSSSFFDSVLCLPPSWFTSQSIVPCKLLVSLVSSKALCLYVSIFLSLLLSLSFLLSLAQSLSLSVSHTLTLHLSLFLSHPLSFFLLLTSIRFCWSRRWSRIWGQGKCPRRSMGCCWGNSIINNISPPWNLLNLFPNRHRNLLYFSLD